MGKTPGMQPRPKREHSGTSPSSANRKRPPGPWPESVVSSVPCSQTYTNILPLLCVSLAPSIARRGAFVNRRVTARDRKIPLGSARRNFVSSPRPLRKNPFRPGFAGSPPPTGEASLGSPSGGDGRQWRPSISGLRCHDRRSWTRPTGAQDPNRQVRRCHAPGVTEGAHPLPPPVRLARYNQYLLGTGGGNLFLK